jgi:hypothetical protein
VVVTRDGRLFVSALDGSGQIQLASSAGWEQIEDVFPDGRIVFETVRAPSDDLSIASPNGSAVVHLAPENDCQAFAALVP